MGETSGEFYGTGARSGRAYKLNSLGIPDAPDATPYIGYDLLAITGLENNIPGARKINIPGNDRNQATITLPRTDPSSATITMSGINMAMIASLSNTKKYAVGEAAAIGYGTDQQGSEADIAIVLNQYGKDAGSKLSRYRTLIYPVVNGVINPASMTDSANKITMEITPQQVDHSAWGSKFTMLTNGFTLSEVEELMCEGRGMLTTWKSGAATVDFPFDADFLPSSTAKINKVTTVAADGTVTDVSGTVTKAADKLTFAITPGNGVYVCCFYELS